MKKERLDKYLTDLGYFETKSKAAAAILAVRAKKKPTIEQIKQMTGKNSHIANLTAEEKEKLIKELQAKTDDMDVKAEIRKLIENGEWDKL